MHLRDLLVYNEVVVQCHDFPDADTIASGYGVYYYLEQKGKKVRLVYSGKEKLKKSNLVLMVEMLKIPIEYVEKMEAPECLVTVDCQYGESNVTPFEARHVVVIDHHATSRVLDGLTEIQPSYGSCSSLVWKMLREEGIDANQDTSLATALYYGLYTDTNGLAEVKHPVDRDLRDTIRFQKSVILSLRNSNLSLEEMRIAGKALENYVYDEEYHFCLVQAAECDPNILGFISDLVIQAEHVDFCVVFCVRRFGIKLSVRTCSSLHRANDLAHCILKGIGNGGGHAEKAGGFIEPAAFSHKYGTRPVLEVLKECIRRYCKGYQVIYAGKYQVDISDMKLYHKKKLVLGYVRMTDVVPAGTPVTVRTLEADLELEAHPEIYVMVGIKGEAYPIRKEKFEKSYESCDLPFESRGLTYMPTLHNRQTGEIYDLLPMVHTCRSTGTVEVYIKELEHGVKVFTSWTTDSYMLGNPGDYMAVRGDDLNDIYVIEKEIFGMTYEPSL